MCVYRAFSVLLCVLQEGWLVHFPSLMAYGLYRLGHGRVRVCVCVCLCLCVTLVCVCVCVCPLLFIFLASQVATLRTSEPKLLEMITTADEKTIQTLLEVNDLLQGALSEYEHVIKHGPRRTAPAPVPAPRSAAVAGGATPVPAGVAAPPKPSCMHVRIVYAV